MSSAGPQPKPIRPSVFLSYASEDRIAARTIRDILTEAGLEVWYDESDLGGGDAWDQVGSSRVDLQACKLEYSIVSPK